MKQNRSCGIAAALSLVLLAAPALAQQAENDYVRTSSWDVKRTHWESFVESFEKNTQPVLEKLFAEGVITEWGISANSVHREDGYTHDIWWAGKSLASLERVLDALDESASPDQRRERSAELAAAIDKHEDAIGRSLLIKTRPTETDEGYFFSSRQKVRPGKGREWRRQWEQVIQPVYDKLLEDGTIYSYGIDVQYVHTADPRYRSVWYAVPTLEAAGKVDAAFDALFEGRSEAENDAFFATMTDTSERAEHRDSMSRIIHYAVK